jgi:hypothetical protein
MIGPTDLLHPSPTPHFKTFQVFLIYCPKRPSFNSMDKNIYVIIIIIIINYEGVCNLNSSERKNFVAECQQCFQTMFLKSVEVSTFGPNLLLRHIQPPVAVNFNHMHEYFNHSVAGFYTRVASKALRMISLADSSMSEYISPTTFVFSCQLSFH